MIYWFPAQIPELKEMAPQARETALKNAARKIWWRFAIWFLAGFIFINLLVNALFHHFWPDAGTVVQALGVWFVQIALLLLLMLPVYCAMLRRHLRKSGKR